jgi:hypothetical protein
MDIRYYVNHLDVWFGIHGSNEDPKAAMFGATISSVSADRIRDFKDIPGDEQTAIEEAHASAAAFSIDDASKSKT